MKKFLEFKLIEVGDYVFTVGDLLTVLLIIIATRLLLWVIRKAFEKKFGKQKHEPGKKYAVLKISGYIIWTIAIIFILQAAGIRITLLLAGSAALLVGIGLGLQQTFNDFISGFILLIDRTIEVNDVIELDNMIGRVEQIGIRTSILVNRDDISVIVPNSKITGANVINWSHTKKESRFSMGIGVAYGSDEEKVRDILQECALNHPLTLREPPPFIRLEEFADSSINFSIYFWTKEVFRVENIKSDLRFSILKKLKEHQITIPFPQMDVYVKQVPKQDV